MAFPAPHFKTPPAGISVPSQREGPKTLKSHQNPSFFSLFSFQNSIYSALLGGSKLSLSQGETCGGLRNGKWGEKRWRGNKNPQSHIQNPAQSQGELKGITRMWWAPVIISQKKDQNQNIPHSKKKNQTCYKHRTDIPNSLFPKQRHVWKNSSKAD